MKFRTTLKIKEGEIYKARYDRPSWPEWHGIYKIKIYKKDVRTTSRIYIYSGKVVEIIEGTPNSRIGLKLGFSESNIREFLK